MSDTMLREQPGRLAIAEMVVGWVCRPMTASDERRRAGWGPGEWAVARWAALVHGVAPLLADRYSGEPAWMALAPSLRHYLAEQHALNARRIALMLADLAEIQRAAAAAGVAVLPLKGAALAARYYPEPGLRPMADLDLLVRPADEPRLAATLAGLGFALAEATPRHRSYHRGAARVASYTGEHPDNPRSVEVHTAVGEQLRGMQIDLTETLWADARPAGDDSGLLPGPGALLQHLLVHTSHNLLNRRLRLIQLYDLALVAPRLSAADWAALRETARRSGEARMLYAPLALAERHFGPLAPPAALAELAAATPLALRRLLEQVTPSELSYCNPNEASPAYKLAWYHPGRERWRSLLHVALPAAHELRQRYPRLARWLPAAYLLHIGHVLRWAARLALRRARHSAPTDAAVGSQKSEVRSQKSEVRGRKSEVRSQRP